MTNPHQRLLRRLDAIKLDLLILKAQTIIQELRRALGASRRTGADSSERA